MGFETLEVRLDPQNQQLPAQTPAGFENQTIQFPDLPHAQTLGADKGSGSLLTYYTGDPPTTERFLSTETQAQKHRL